MHVGFTAGVQLAGHALGARPHPCTHHIPTHFPKQLLQLLTAPRRLLSDPPAGELGSWLVSDGTPLEDPPAPQEGVKTPALNTGCSLGKQAAPTAQASRSG